MFNRFHWIYQTDLAFVELYEDYEVVNGLHLSVRKHMPLRRRHVTVILKISLWIFKGQYQCVKGMSVGLKCPSASEAPLKSTTGQIVGIWPVVTHWKQRRVHCGYYLVVQTSSQTNPNLTYQVIAGNSSAFDRW